MRARFGRPAATATVARGPGSCSILRTHLAPPGPVTMVTLAASSIPRPVPAAVIVTTHAPAHVRGVACILPEPELAAVPARAPVDGTTAAVIVASATMAAAVAAVVPTAAAAIVTAHGVAAAAAAAAVAIAVAAAASPAAIIGVVVKVRPTSIPAAVVPGCVGNADKISRLKPTTAGGGGGGYGWARA